MIFIWAEDQNHAIGLNGELPWHLPADLAFFKKNTIGKTLVSGRRTFASYKKPLPHRKHIVLTTSAQATYPDDITIVRSAEEVVAYEQQHPDETIVISGGAQVFETLMPFVDVLLRTRVHAVFNADTYMPLIDYNKFELVSSETREADEKNQYALTFERWERL